MTNNILKSLGTDAISLDREINEKTDQLGEIQERNPTARLRVGLHDAATCRSPAPASQHGRYFRGSDKLLPNGSRALDLVTKRDA